MGCTLSKLLLDRPKMPTAAGVAGWRGGRIVTSPLRHLGGATPPPRFPFALPRSETPVTTLLSVLQGAHSAGEGIFGFLSTREANTLRLVCGEFRDAVSEARWHDETTRISGSLAAWRACFPNARAANVAGRADLQDADFAHLAGLKALNMSGLPRDHWCGPRVPYRHPHAGHERVPLDHRRGPRAPGSPARASRTSPASTRCSWAGAKQPPSEPLACSFRRRLKSVLQRVASIKKPMPRAAWLR